MSHLFFVAGFLALTVIPALADDVILRTVKKEGVDTLSSDDYRRYDDVFLEAMRQRQQGNDSIVVQLLNDCIELDSTLAAPYFFLGDYHGHAGKDSLALACFQKAASLGQENFSYQQRLAEFYLYKSDYDRAIEVFELLVNNSPTRTEVLGLLAQLYQQKKDYPALLHTLERIEKADGVSENLVLAKMQVHSLMGEDQRAFDELEGLVKKYPNDLNYKVMLGNWLLGKERKDEALKVYRQVLNEEPDHVLATISLLDYYQGENQREEENRLMEQLLSSDKPETSDKLMVIRRFVSRNDEEGGDSLKVLSLFNRLLSRPQKNSDIADFYASYLEYKSCPKDTIRAAWHKSLQIAPDNAMARSQLITMEWQEAKYDAVIELSLPALKYNPDEMVFYYYLGLAYFQKDRRDDALDAFRRGVSQINMKSNPEMVSDFYAIMGDIFHQKGMNAEAYAAYDSCLHWKEDNIACLNNYAYFLSESADSRSLEKACEMSKKTVDKEPQNSTYLDTYAWILFRMKRYGEAKIYIDRAMENLADTLENAVIIEHCGDIYSMNGDVDGAMGYWKEALRIAPDNKVLARKIRRKKYVKK